MPNYNEMRLSGGVFYALVSHYMKARSDQKDEGGVNATLTAPGCLLALIQVFKPDFRETTASFKGNVTKYKRCELSSNVNLPFNDVSAIRKFHKAVTTDYITPLGRMRDFCNNYVQDGDSSDDLIRGLLEVMSADPDIYDSTPFYVMLDGTPVPFADIRFMDEFYLPAFLLGLWDYILVHRPDNRVGKDTYWQLFTPVRSREDVWDNLLGTGPRFASVIHQKPAKETLERLHLTAAPKEPLKTEIYSDLAGDYSLYLSRAKNRESRIKTLLYPDDLMDFYSIYVPNRVKMRSGRMRNGEVEPLRNPEVTISDVTVASIASRTNFIVLTGQGGIGKSMMMRHLLCSAVDTCAQTKMVPVLIYLKNFAGPESSLFDTILSAIRDLQPSLSEDAFLDDLRNGHFILLFDGLDEVRSAWRESLENELERFTGTYSHNIFIISSRPYSRFVHMTMFSVANVLPLDKAQVFELVDRLNYRPEDPHFTENFKKAIDDDLYESHNDFVCNPLLLNIMLLTFNLYADIPAQRHLFYRRAYDALAQHHDATKPGGLHRVWETGWTPERLAQVFSEFCARTYIREEYEFTPEEMERTFRELRELRRRPEDARVSVQAFTSDLMTSVCLLYQNPDSKDNNDNYYFTHRSFQEYFCALFFSNQSDADMKATGEYFERRNVSTDSDAAFAMFYDMVPRKVEENILLPYLGEVFSAGSAEENYERYLLKCYPEIRSVRGSCVDQILTPASYLMRFICGRLALDYTHYNLKLTPWPEFREEDFYYLNLSDDDNNPDFQIFPESWFNEHNLPLPADEADHSGTTYRIPVDTLFAHPDRYGPLIDELSSSRFYLRVEFRVVYGYYQELKARYSNTHGADPFGFFHQEDEITKTKRQ